jgi:thioredoxin-related protein
MKKLVSLILAVLLSFSLLAEKVEIERAKNVAKNWYCLQLKQLRDIEKEDLKLFTTFENKRY